MRELRVRLFGPFQIMSGDEPMLGPVLRKAQELLAVVLLAPQRRIRREVAVDRVWPVTGPDASRKAMRQALWQIHQAADVALPAGQRLVLTDGETIRVNPDRRLWLDVADFTDSARVAQSTAAEALADTDLVALEQASALYRGPLLAGCADDWCLVQRAHLEDLHLTVLDKLSTGHENRGDLVPAIYWAQRLLEVEPAHERSHRRLMRLYYRTDDRIRALRQYRRCQWVLEHDLGIQPSARTRSLAAEIGADAAAVPDPPDEARPSVRASLDDFRAELAALRASVDAISDRLGAG